MRAPVTLFLVLVSVTSVIVAQAPRPNAGRAAFERTCARCHGADGRGGEMGPGITTRIPLRTDQELAMLVRAGLPAKGMPGFQFPDAELHRYPDCGHYILEDAGYELIQLIRTFL